jgi:PAS domain S-box-containing protein
MPLADSSIIANPTRLETLRRYCLLDTPADPAFDRLSQLAARILKAPIALVSLVDENRQFFKSQVGLTPPLATRREAPLSHSFCQHVVALSAPLIVEDAREHPLLHDNLAIVDYNVSAYLGIPLVAPSGETLGSFCVLDTKPRRWAEEEVTLLQELAASVMTEVELRARIMERQTMEASLRKTEARYSSAIATMHEGVVLQDRDGAIEACNPAAEAILGLTSEQMMGRTSIDPRWHAVHEDGSPFPGETHPAMVALRTGTPQLNVVMGIYKPDSTLTWILINSEPLIEPGTSQPYAVMTTFLDITERKQAEKQAMMLALEKERVNLLTQFIHHSSHEFRTPLAIIQSSVYLMNRTEDPQKREHKARIIRSQIERITQLVDTLQKLSRLDSQPTLVMALTDISRIISLVLQEQELHAEKPIQFHLEHASPLPRIAANAEHLQDALRQLLHNAVRFSRPGGVVSVRTACENNTILIQVGDEGIGIPDEVLPRIFERFYRGDGLQSNPGFGLGLPIAQSIVEKHGGSIRVKSQPGSGTLFTIALPIRTP